MKTIKLPVFRDADPEKESVMVDFTDVSDDVEDYGEVICEKYCPLGRTCLDIKTKKGDLIDVCGDLAWLDLKDTDDRYYQALSCVPTKEVFEVAFGDDPETLTTVMEKFKENEYDANREA